MSTDDGKRVAQEWADAMQRLREERDELASFLRDAADLLDDYMESLEKKGASLNYGRNFVRNIRIAVARIAR